MMTTTLFVIANVKQLRTDGSFRILLPFFQTSWGVGLLNSAIFNSFHNRVEFGTILKGFRNFGGGVTPPNPPSPHPPSRYATGCFQVQDRKVFCPAHFSNRFRGWPWLRRPVAFLSLRRSRFDSTLFGAGILISNAALRAVFF